MVYVVKNKCTGDISGVFDIYINAFNFAVRQARIENVVSNITKWDEKENMIQWSKEVECV